MGKLTVKNGKKTCRKCKKEKLVKEFGFTKDARFGKSYIDSECKECRKAAVYVWRAKNPAKYRLTRLRYNERLKTLVLANYGVKGNAVCVACGFNDIRALCIDHILNNGAEERLRLRDKYFAGSIFHRWLRDNGFPAGYQTLCANCNLIKEIERRRNK